MKTIKNIIPLAFLFTIGTGILQFQLCDGLGSIGSPDIDTFFLDKTFLEYTYTPMGNYYVYQEVTSGEIDSTFTAEFHIKGNGIDFSEVPGFRNSVSESRYCKLKLLGEFRACAWYLGDDPTTEVESDKSYHGLSDDLDHSFPIVGTKYHTRLWEDSSIPHNDYYQFKHDSFKIHGKWFKDVVQVKKGTSWEAAPFIHQTYYTRGIGPVCREYADGTKWLLIRHGKY